MNFPGLLEAFRPIVGPEKPAEPAWLHFAAEVVGPSLHYYLGDAPMPRVAAARRLAWRVLRHFQLRRHAGEVAADVLGNLFRVRPKLPAVSIL